MTDKLKTIHPELGKFDFYEAKNKRDWAYAKGIGSKEWIEFATFMFEQFPLIYNTCLLMNEEHKNDKDKITELEKQLVEARALIVEQYNADKDLYESPDYTTAIDYEPMLTRHDKSFESLGNYVKDIADKGEIE